MEVMIIGAIAAGMSAAAKAARVNPDANITVIDIEAYVSFGACGLPYYLGKQFEDPNTMFARSPQQMRDAGINLMLEHKVVAVDFDNKIVRIRDLKSDKKIEKKYDRLLIATGATPHIPPAVAGMDSENVYTFTKLKAVQDIKDNLAHNENYVIVGGGFIGIEVAEQLAQLGKTVHLIQAGHHLIPTPFDAEFSEKIQTALEAKGVKIHLNNRFEKATVVDGKVTQTFAGDTAIATDVLILATGFRPNTGFLTDTRLKKLGNGAIIIDQYGRTSIKDVFSAGDCASVPHRQRGDVYMPLATSANKLGRLIGTNIVSDEEDYLQFVGTLGSSAIKVGDFEAGSTGLTEKMAHDNGYNYKTTLIETNNHTDYWPDQTKIMIKLIYEADTKILLGAQVFAKSDAVLRLTGLTTAIHAGLTTTELGFIDYSYSPPFSSTWEALNVAANTAK